MRQFFFAMVLVLAWPAYAGVTVVQNVAPGATSWPGSPLISTMANPSVAGVPQSFTNGVAGFPSSGGNSDLSQTFTITTTNYVLQTINIYAGGGTGTGAGTNLTLNLFDLGVQSAPNPSPYRWAASYSDIIGPNLFGSGAGLAVSYANQVNGVLEFDFTGSDQVLLQAGHMYVFELTSTANRNPISWLSVTNSNPYSGGAAYINQDWANFPSVSANEFAMAVYATVTSSVPNVPAPLTGACTVNWTDEHQRIDGFGGSSAFRQFTGFTTAQADMFFSTNTGLGLSLLRTMIYEGGNSSSAETSIAQQAVARGARVWSAPWSPAVQFKIPQITNGGNYAGLGANATNLAYASQLASYVVKMQNQGIPLYAISIQNEPDFTTAAYDSCGWTAQQIHDFPTNLYNAFVASNVASTKILLPESLHWQSNTNLYATAMNDPVVASVVGIISNHNYDNTPPSGTPVAIPSFGKARWESETAILNNPQGKSGISDSSMQNGIYWAGRLHAFLTVAEVNAWHHWWLITGGSNPTSPEQGLTDFNFNVLAKRGYVMGQYSRFVRPNFNRIGVVTNSGAVTVSAYKDTNSINFAIVAVNPNYTNPVSQTFNLNNVTTTGTVTPWITSPTLSLASQTPIAVTGSSFTYTLPAMSVVTFVGKASTNIAPTLAPIPDQTVDVGTTLLVTNSATDPGVPPETLTFSLLDGPAGATLTPLDSTSALFSWQPTTSDADTTNLVTVVVTDSGIPNRSATNSFNVIVNPVANTAPVLSPISDQIINPGMTLLLTNVATDPEVPPQILTFTLAKGPTNASLSGLDATSALFTWRPLVSQANTTNLVSVQVADDGIPSLSATNSFNVIVNPTVPTFLSSITVSSGQVNFTVDGTQGPDYTFWTSTNLIDWELVFTTNSPTLPFQFSDTNSTDVARFYRVQIGP